MAPTPMMTRRARRAFAELPTDVLFDVFLLLSTKELCRLRVVCRSWRSLTCDPHFIRAHAARHQRDPLFVASFLSEDGEEMRIDLIDLSGKTVKRVASGMAPGQVLCPRLGLVLVANKADNTCRVLDPAAAADAKAPVARRFRLPVLPAPSHRGPGSRRRLREAATSFAFGRVGATGEHKVVRILHRLKDDDRPHLFEVLTLTLAGGDRRRRGRARWRDMPSPDMFVCPDSSVVVDGVVYFLRNSAVYKDMAALPSAGADIDDVPPADCIASFNLEREEWRKRLQGPISMGMGYHGDDSDDEPQVDLNYSWCEFALAELRGSLVLVNFWWYTTHLWILTDFERGVWVKECSIRVHSIEPAYLRRPKPLFVLDDGRLLVRQRVGGQLAVYDPVWPYMHTGAWTWVMLGRPYPHGQVGIYEGSLLGSQDVW